MVSSTPRPHFTPGKDPVPILQEAGWAPGPVWTGAENLVPTGIRSPYRPARSQSLYRLRYAAHNLSDNSLVFGSRSLTLRKQSVGPSSRTWFISLSASVSRHSSYYVKAEIRIPVASEISTAVLAHRSKAVTALDPYISKNTESFSHPVRCTALNKKLTRH